jgi:hypothetical protein
VALLVEGAEHVTAHSGHNVMIDNAPVVIDAIDTSSMPSATTGRRQPHDRLSRSVRGMVLLPVGDRINGAERFAIDAVQVDVAALEERGLVDGRGAQGRDRARRFFRGRGGLPARG